MAQVTIELRTLLQVEEFDLFNFDYGIIDQSWKEEFERDFKEYYYFNEIGQETADRFKQRLKSRLREIMPYYNQLYKTTLLDIDPLINYRLKETFEEDQSAESSSATDDSNTSTRTDYPQHANVVNDIPTERIGYKGDTKTSTRGDSVRDYKKIIEGSHGNIHEALAQYRNNIININKLMIRECKDLFILVY